MRPRGIKIGEDTGDAKRLLAQTIKIQEHWRHLPSLVAVPKPAAKSFPRIMHPAAIRKTTQLGHTRRDGILLAERIQAQSSP